MIFVNKVNNDIGLQFVGFIPSPFLYINFIIENFKWSGKIPDKKDLLQI